MNVASSLLDLASARPGHFAMESGLHSALWLDLDALFAEPDRIDPFVGALADALVHAVARQAFETWAPADCPQCAAGVPLEHVV